MVVGSEKPPADGVEKYESPRIFGQAEKKQQEEEQQLKEKPQEWKSKMRNTTSVKTKANFRPRVK